MHCLPKLQQLRHSLALHRVQIGQLLWRLLMHWMRSQHSWHSLMHCLHSLQPSLPSCRRWWQLAMQSLHSLQLLTPSLRHSLPSLMLGLHWYLLRLLWCLLESHLLEPQMRFALPQLLWLLQCLRHSLQHLPYRLPHRAPTPQKVWLRWRRLTPFLLLWRNLTLVPQR